MIDLNELSPTDFEELRYNLLLKLGLKNINWRKGKTSSPFDSGRNIQISNAITLATAEKVDKLLII